MVSWLLQNNYVTALTARMAVALRDMGRTLYDFSVVPGEPLPESLFNYPRPRYFHGSTALVKRLWENAAFREDIFFTPEAFDQRTWNLKRGATLLNGQGENASWADLVQFARQEAFFVRPTVDQKTFTGAVVMPAQFTEWAYQQEQRNPNLLPETPVWVSRVQVLQAEYRFVVARHALVAGSSYRVDGQHMRSADIPAEVLEAARDLAKGWLPAELVTMDVARLADGTFRIIEFNCIHTSGLYAIPLPAFIEGVEAVLLSR